MDVGPWFFMRPIWPCHDKCCVNSGRIWIGRVLVGYVGLVGWLVGGCLVGCWLMVVGCGGVLVVVSFFGLGKGDGNHTVVVSHFEKEVC